MTEDRPIGGWCDPAFVGVADAFADNFTERDEAGAAVCVTLDGRVVVNLWGGHADAAGTRAWGPDTLVNAFSVGKGFIALLVAQLVGQGALDVDLPVASVWPEFAAAGKASTTVRHLLSHQAGLPALHDPVPDAAMFDWSAMTAALADEAPWWEPGAEHGYHVNTFGFLVGEVLRRLTGRTPGELLRRQVAGPLDADVHLGVSASEDHRIADTLWPDGALPQLQPGAGGDELMRYNAYFNPPGFSGAGLVNTRAWRGAELPSTNTHASARGVARVYAALAAGGRLDGTTIVDPGALRAATAEQVAGPDRILGRPSRFGLGFQLTQPDRPLGPNADSFGHFGAGGSLGLCDPTSGLAFGYVMNRFGPRWQNPRTRALLAATFESLD